MQHVNNGNVFRKVTEVLVKNVNPPPNPRPLMIIRQPPPLDDHTTACATCASSVTKEVLVKNVNTPPPPPTPTPPMIIRQHVNIFRNVKEVLVKNVNTPPTLTPTPPDDHTTACQHLP